MGDFNFDLLNYETDTGTAGFLKSIVQFGFLPLVHVPNFGGCQGRRTGVG